MGEPKRAGRGAGQRRSRERREQLLRAALGLLERGGAKAITHRAVSEAAGLPAATAAYYFPAVSDLTTAAISFHVEQGLQLLSVIDAATRDREMPTPIDLARETAERIATGRSHVAIGDYEVFLEAARNPDFRPIAAAGRRETERLFSTFLSAMGAAGASRAARVHVALIDGFALRQLAFGSEGVDVDTATDAFVAQLAYRRATGDEREHIRADLQGPLAAVPPASHHAHAEAPQPDTSERRGRGASQQRSRDRREQLLAAAIELFEAGGSKAITHRAVSQTAGLPPATAGYYFPQIEDLVTAAVEFHVRGRLDAIAAMVDEARHVAGSPLELIELTSRSIAAGASGLRSTHFELFLEAARHAEFRPIAAAARRDFEALATNFLARLGAHDPGRGAQAYLAITEGLALQRLAAGGGDEDDVALASESVIALVHFHRAAGDERRHIRESLMRPTPTSSPQTAHDAGEARRSAGRGAHAPPSDDQPSLRSPVTGDHMEGDARARR